MLIARVPSSQRVWSWFMVFCSYAVQWVVVARAGLARASSRARVNRDLMADLLPGRLPPPAPSSSGPP
jgi:hypothetical protein